MTIQLLHMLQHEKLPVTRLVRQLHHKSSMAKHFWSITAQVTQSQSFIYTKCFTTHVSIHLFTHTFTHQWQVASLHQSQPACQELTHIHTQMEKSSEAILGSVPWPRILETTRTTGHLKVDNMLYFLSQISIIWIIELPQLFLTQDLHPCTWKFVKSD